MSLERNYYKLDPEGKSLAAINKFLDDNQATRKAWSDWCESHGATKYYAGSYMQGLRLENPDPDLWARPISAGLPSGCYKPKRVKGNPITKEMNALPYLKMGMELTQEYLGLKAKFHGNAIYYASYEFVGKEIILTLVDGQEPPEDAMLMKKSEYYQMVEAEQEKAA